MNIILYSTDASTYKEQPDSVIILESESEIFQLINDALNNGKSIIPRGAGTSLAGQVVGNGIVVDVSKNFRNILELNETERWVRVESGVVLDQLNLFLKPFGLFFGPETSTANRCTLGGMLGNNSCGLHSLVYGSVREHILEVSVILSDGSKALFRELSDSELETKICEDTLEGRIYRDTIDLLKRNKNEIIDNYPDPEVKRRNTGYALDELLKCSYFDKQYDNGFNLSKLIAGSEGTLAFVTELKLNLVPLPPKEKALICVHCSSLEETFYGNLVALKHSPMSVELMDDKIIELSKQNITQSANRFFIKGEPKAILIIEVAEHTKEELDNHVLAIIDDLKKEGYGYHYPIILGKDIKRVWDLRKAGLGLLSNIPGSAKPVSVIEDTAVAPRRLPDYMRDFQELMKKYNLDCVYHAHIATGELHLRPILDLKKETDVLLFREIAKECALLVKKHKGSLSGEHGDGRLRGEFIPIMYGEKVYQLHRDIKKIWDQNNVFNAGKIVDTPAMNTYLRYSEPPSVNTDYKTYFDFSSKKGWLSAIEQCNGSGDCRKTYLSTGTMCPSYRATLDERDSTRARANILRELLTYPKTKKIFDQQEIYDVLDRCVSCKACKSECPSNVDIARFKAEYLQHYYDVKGVSLRAYLVSNMAFFQKIGSIIPTLYNFVVSFKPTSAILKSLLKFSTKRSIPKVAKRTAKSLIKREQIGFEGNKRVYLFLDEFTNYLDAEVGLSFVKLMNKFGYKVVVPKHVESGRAALSKGLLKKAKRIAEKNVKFLSTIVNDDNPIVGIEPSCILSFRDEYPDLVSGELKEAAKNLAKNSLLYDEFVMQIVQNGLPNSIKFTEENRVIYLHGHCHQKTLASVDKSAQILSLPINYSVEIIPSGCCGMAGSFGYEREHYELSMTIGEGVLFPYIRNKSTISDNFIVSAPGTSCREQILHGTGMKAYHPIEILLNSME